MKTPALLAVLALVTSVTALSVAPTAEARAFCVWGVDDFCPGLVCTWDRQHARWSCLAREPYVECVTEPCYCTCDPETLPYYLP